MLRLCPETHHLITRPKREATSVCYPTNRVHRGEVKEVTFYFCHVKLDINDRFLNLVSSVK